MRFDAPENRFHPDRVAAWHKPALFMKVLLRRHISALWLEKLTSGCST
jgi:hypothetical protein